MAPEASRWYDPTFQYKQRHQQKEILGYFDIRDELCISVGGFRHGQIIESIHGQHHIVVGVQQDDAGIVGFWAQPEGEDAAIQVDPTEVWYPRGYRHLEADAGFTSNSPLKETFKYRAGAFDSKLTKFDIRSMALGHFGFQHGDLVVTHEGHVATVIGLKEPSQDLRMVTVWCHVEGLEGATPFHPSDLRTLGQRCEVCEVAPSDGRAPSEHCHWLRPTFRHRRGQSPSSPVVKFDIRDDICVAVGGFKHGQVVMYAGTKYAVVGVHQSYEDRRLGLWFRPVCGRAFAGMFDAEDLKTLEICGTCQIAEALEVGALVKLKAGIDPGDLGPMKVNDVTTLREDDGSENPYRIFHRGEEWWYSAELLVMVDEHSEPTVTTPQKSRPKNGQLDLKLEELRHQLEKQATEMEDLRTEKKKMEGLLQKEKQKRTKATRATEQLQNQLQRVRAEKATSDDALAREKQHLIQKEKAMVEKAQAMSEKESNIINKMSEISMKESEMSTKERAVTEKEEQFQSMQRALAAVTEKEEQFQSTQRALAAKEEQFQSMQRALAELEDQRGEALDSLQRLDSERQLLIQELQAFEERKAALEDEVQKKEELLDKDLRTLDPRSSRLPYGTYQWKFEDDHGNFACFGIEDNDVAMQAFCEGRKVCTISSNRKLDFEKMIQIQMSSSKERRIKICFGIPAHWSITDEDFLKKQNMMNSPGHAPSFDCRVQEVVGDDVLQDFTKLLNGSAYHHEDILGSLALATSSTCETNFRVRKVFQVQNLDLLHRYVMYCQDLQRRRKNTRTDPIEPAVGEALKKKYESMRLEDGIGAVQNECLLFHGTSFETAKIIADEGFDSRLAKDGYYGKGTYFASQSCKSAQYSRNSFSQKCIILARVVLGHPHYADRCNNRFTRPPADADSVIARPGEMGGHHGGYQTHMEFVIFHQWQAYPEFIVLYD